MNVDKVFKYEGNNWKMSPLDRFDIADEFEPWLYMAACRRAEKLKPKHGKDQLANLAYEEMKSDLRDSWIRGRFAFGADLFMSAITFDKDAFAQAVYLCLLPNHPSIDLDEVKAMLAKEKDLPADKKIINLAFQEASGFLEPKTPSKKAESEKTPENGSTTSAPSPSSKP